MRCLVASIVLMLVSLVEARAATVTAEQYVASAAAELRRAVQPLGGRFELSPQGSHRNIDLSDQGAVDISTSSPRRVAPEMTVWVELKQNGRSVRRVPVRFRVQWFRHALTARSRLAARTAVTADMFELREVDIARHASHALANFTELDGRRLRLDLRAGAPLVAVALEPRPPVETGERIRVVATVGGVTVERAAIAQRDGFAGQRIAARVIGGTETLRVEVMGENVARVYGES